LIGADHPGDFPGRLEHERVEWGAGSARHPGHQVKKGAHSHRIDESSFVHNIDHLAANLGNGFGVFRDHGFTQSDEKSAMRYATIASIYSGDDF
jgi:hypothetical protein